MFFYYFVDTKCVDKNEACRHFAKMNHCVDKEDWMVENCKKTCNKCGKLNI